MFRSKHVTKTDHKKGHHVHSVHKDKKTFSHTAERTEKVNTGSGRPMRGGIRL